MQVAATTISACTFFSAGRAINNHFAPCHMIGRMVRENIASCMLTIDIPWFLRSFPSLSPHLLGTLWSFFSILNILQLYGLEVLYVATSCKQKAALCWIFCSLNH